jgi:hypothetical protein
MSTRKDSENQRQHFLDLDRETFEVGGDFWATSRVRAVEPSDEIPHGFRYALTMHTPRDGRIIGYDNAHMPENLIGTGKPDGTSIVAWDHRHLRDSEARHYEFRSPEQLLQDFWSDVYRILREEGIL